MKQVSQIYPAPAKHWVGDGFFVHNMFHYQQTDKNLDPFLLMDYASPEFFAANASDAHRGVGEHPHRGFETVTIAYQGEVSHQDSAGGGGTIGTGDVQWMTAGSGVMHQEFHSKAFSATGGMFEMVQLWVNLSAKDKMTTPKYQAIGRDEIATVSLKDGIAARIIAGTLDGVTGAADTFSPINLWDLAIKSGGRHTFTLPSSHNLLILVRSGSVQINDEQIANACQLASFHRGGSQLTLQANDDAQLLILTGEPLNEPITGYGPFVMNDKAQIVQAFDDLKMGKFGQIVQHAKV
ncbi:pirin family protein [Moraxella marmotae]|uniref:pirin family protein n=1 Tax=Moraxella marmotae TaxID=3344520 RepID=UPI0035F24DF3